MAPRVAAVAVLFVVSSSACVGGDLGGEALEQGVPAGLHDGQPGALMQTVLLGMTHADGSGGGCTATLLGPRTILTAAHCVTSPSGSPLTWGEIRIPANRGSGRAETMGIAPDRVRRHPTYPLTGESGGEVYDVALVGLRAAVSLPVTNMPWALTSTTRAQDGGAFWINGRIGPTGTDPQWDLFHQVAVMGQLDLDDPRYPFQYVDRCVDFAHPCAVQSGDSGGPVFRESSAEDNDGMGGATSPILFAIATRGGSWTRLDPIALWIEQQRAELEAMGDLPTTCDNGVAVGETVCAFVGDDAVYRCVNPGGQSAPDVPNTQWSTTLCQDDTTCQDYTGHPWCLVP